MKPLDLLLFAAAVLLSVGAALVYAPAGVLVAGVSCVAAWVLLDGEGR